MLNLRTLHEGWRNLLFVKLRSLLALLGILVGTASVVAMVLGGELATNETLKQFTSLGTDLLALNLHTNELGNMAASGTTQHLSLNQALMMRHINAHIQFIAPYTDTYQSIIYEANPVSAVTLGVTDDFKAVMKLTLQSGRFISLLDQYTPYCVIGHGLYNTLKQIRYREPLGQQLTIGNTVFTIIGVLAPWPQNDFVYVDLDNAIMVPIKAAMLISRYAEINNIVMQLSPHAVSQEIEKAFTAQLQRDAPTQLVSFRSAKALISKMQKQRDVLTSFLGLISSISLLVGGIGIMNIMLIAVTERRCEIGIRRAVGATRLNIAQLFLAEALLLSLAGGLGGIVVGTTIAYLLALARHWTFIWLGWPILLGFSVSVAVGVFSGFYPAYLASKLDPITALRSA